MGFDVLAIDANEQRTQAVSNIVTHAVSADSTDEEALRALGIRNFDVVVVAIGQDIQASILTTLIVITSYSIHYTKLYDTYRTLTAADSAVMLIDVAKGVEAQTIKLFQVCAKRGIPIFTFINKLSYNFV